MTRPYKGIKATCPHCQHVEIHKKVDPKTGRGGVVVECGSTECKRKGRRYVVVFGAGSRGITIEEWKKRQRGK